MQPLEILLYTAPEGKTLVEVYFEDETFWLSQKKMAELFGVDVRTINEHLQNILKTKELDELNRIASMYLDYKTWPKPNSNNTESHKTAIISQISMKQ